MNKILGITITLFTLFVLAGCAATPFDKVVASLDDNSATTHFLGAHEVKSTSVDSDWCPNWTGFKPLARCYEYSESYPQHSGTTENPFTVPIVSYTVGQLQLHGERVSSSQGLDWTDEKGNSVKIENMQEGVLYTFHKTSSPASFDLIQK